MPTEPAINQFLRDRGIEPTDDRKKNLELARPFFTTYEQNKKKLEKKKWTAQ